jgi:hypothetical protein
MTRMRRPLRQPAPDLILRPLRIRRRERRGRDRPGVIDLLRIASAFVNLVEGFLQVQGHIRERGPQRNRHHRQGIPQIDEPDQQAGMLRPVEGDHVIAAPGQGLGPASRPEQIDLQPVGAALQEQPALLDPFTLLAGDNTSIAVTT